MQWGIVRRSVLIALAVLSVAASACQRNTPSTGSRASAPFRPRSSVPAAASSPLATAPSLSPISVAEPPAPDASIPTDPISLSVALSTTTRALRDAVDAWVRRGDPSRGDVPQPVALLALYQQRIYGVFVAKPALARRTMARLPRWLAAEARANTSAGAELSSITAPVGKPAAFRTGPPQAAGVLLGYFKQAERRFGVDWQLLAAVMFVESKFGRTRSASGAGAQGPMQFLPATWAAYGMGGNIQDPHDAILGAANYLHQSGAPGNDRAALFHYNPSLAYVDAVLLFAGQMKGDVHNYYAYYNWQVFLRTKAGVRRLTGPGL